MSGPTEPDLRWSLGTYPFKLRIGELTLASLPLRLWRRSASVSEPTLRRTDLPAAPSGVGDADGFAIWAQPVAEALPVMTSTNGTIVYAPHQYERFYVDLAGTYEGYLAKFSGKSRSTLKRKIRKFAELSGGTIDWRSYRSPDLIPEFLKLAREVSETTYQERLLDAGLPATAEFAASACALAERDAVRAYLLFLQGKPIAYLYCPIRNGTLEYQYLGYVPSHAQLSPGTVLQSLALEAIFKEGVHRVFDFTGGEGEHKRFFSTNSVRCADLFVLHRTVRLSTIIALHRGAAVVSDTAGAVLDRLGLKARIRRLLRGR